MNYTIITGATSGIGYELAFEYAKNGHHLILIARRRELLESIKDKLTGLYGIAVETIVLDLNQLDVVESILVEINNLYDIDTVIHNAGSGHFEAANALSTAAITQQSNLNVIAPMLFTRHLIDNVIRNQGSMIYIASILSYFGNIKAAVYVSNKHAILGFANTIRLEFPNLHVLTVHPSTVQTNFFKDEDAYKRNVLSPATVANHVYKAHKRKKRTLNVPKSIRYIRLMYLLFPNMIDRINRKYFTNK